MKVLSPRDYRKMPWKNGAGATTEIAIAPAGSEFGDQPFLWRVSIADIPASGAFSLFPGYDRTILLLEGGGMMLDGPERASIDLSRRLCPATFPGEWPVFGRLLSGPVRDFNLMIERRRATSRLEILELTQARRLARPPGATLIAYVVEGSLRGAPAEHALIADHALDLEPTAATTIISITIREFAKSGRV
ncbi:MAG: HutD family protein [Pseudomonadota bacterium]|nr:HutD family protein [Pseudomonadota bacterium]